MKLIELQKTRVNVLEYFDEELVIEELREGGFELSLGNSRYCKLEINGSECRLVGESPVKVINTLVALLNRLDTTLSRTEFTDLGNCRYKERLPLNFREITEKDLEAYEQKRAPWWKKIKKFFSEKRTKHVGI